MYLGRNNLLKGMCVWQNARDDRKQEETTFLNVI